MKPTQSGQPAPCAQKTAGGLRAPTRPCWVVLACLPLFAGCGRAPSNASDAQPAAATQAAATLASALAPDVQTWSLPAAGCTVLEPGFTSSQGQFRVLECHPDAAATQQADDPLPVVLRFQHLGPDGETSKTYGMDQSDYSAIVADALVPKFWDGHVLTLLLEQERGGQWLIANWTGSAFVLVPYDYLTGDEDGFEVMWYDDGFTVTTQPEGQRRVVTGGPGSQPGEFANESVACSDDSGGISQQLRLGLDTDGSVFDFMYSSAIPAGDGTSHVCLIQSAHGGADSWGRAGNGDITIDIPSGDDPIPDSQVRIRMDQAQPEQIQAGTPAIYRVVMDVVPASFCGQSDAIAEEISLKADTPRCASIRMPKRGSDD